MGFIRWGLAISAEDPQVSLPICISFLWGWLVFPEGYPLAFSLEDRCGEENWLPVFCILTREKGSHYIVDTMIHVQVHPLGRKDLFPWQQEYYCLTSLSCEIPSEIDWWNRTASPKVISLPHNNYSPIFD